MPLSGAGLTCTANHSSCKSDLLSKLTANLNVYIDIMLHTHLKST